MIIPSTYSKDEPVESLDEEFSLEEFLELDDQQEREGQERSDLQNEDEDLITPIPNQPVTSLT